MKTTLPNVLASYVALTSLVVGCDSVERRATEEEALRRRPPVATESLGQAMGTGERAMPKLPTAQDHFLFAVRRGDLEGAKRWRAAGGQLDGEEAVLVAAIRGTPRPDLIAWLVEEGAPIDAFDDSGRSALSWSAGRGESDYVDYFLTRGADLSSTDRLGRTPLHFAVFSGKASIVERMVAGGAELDAQDRVGSTALMYACAKNARDVVKVLEDAGANPSLVDALGRDAADRAHGDDNPCRNHSSQRSQRR